MEPRQRKIDYILLPPPLQDAVVAAGIERRGVWGGANYLPRIKFWVVVRTARLR